jgi:hypothetical protein
MSDAFDVIPFEVSQVRSSLRRDMSFRTDWLRTSKVNWEKLGSGSVWQRYKGSRSTYCLFIFEPMDLTFSGTYLGISVAIKEVLPSKEYDVSKIFRTGVEAHEV